MNTYFVHIPKTGGTSVSRYLNRGAEHYTARDKIAEIGEDAWLQSFRFSLVRNPFDRAVALWAWRRMRTNHPSHTDKPFPKWAAEQFSGDPVYYELNGKTRKELETADRFMPQVYYICGPDGSLSVNAVFRYEHLGQNFPGIAWINRSDRSRDWVKYYDKASVQAVQRFFADDLEMFRYEYDPDILA